MNGITGPFTLRYLGGCLNSMIANDQPTRSDLFLRSHEKETHPLGYHVGFCRIPIPVALGSRPISRSVKIVFFLYKLHMGLCAAR